MCRKCAALPSLKMFGLVMTPSLRRLFSNVQKMCSMSIFLWTMYVMIMPIGEPDCDVIAALLPADLAAAGLLRTTLGWLAATCSAEASSSSSSSSSSWSSSLASTFSGDGCLGAARAGDDGLFLTFLLFAATSGLGSATSWLGSGSAGTGGKGGKCGKLMGDKARSMILCEPLWTLSSRLWSQCCWKCKQFMQGSHQNHEIAKTPIFVVFSGKKSQKCTVIGAILVHFWCTFSQKCTKSAPNKVHFCHFASGTLISNRECHNNLLMRWTVSPCFYEICILVQNYILHQ